MKPTCPRLFEVEALRDGRLTGAGVARFEAHVGVCAICARELQDLQALGATLRCVAKPVDELHIRRERTRLLAAFDASMVPQPRSRRWLAPVVALAVLCAVLLVFWRAPRAPGVSAVATLQGAVGIRADSSARWSRRAENQLEKVFLESGTLSIHVDHAGSERRLLVILPDGELEDIGTTFSVSVDDGHTTRVTVQEGRVVLRLSGKAPLALGAGDSWSPAPPVVVTSATSPPAPRSAKPAPPAAAIPAPPPALAPNPSADFRAAMSALSSGQNAQAAALFGAFLGKHPRDSRAEDAAYLRVLALQRAGNAASMEQAASEYLQRYPRGFRKAEVQPLAR